jgi:hypothetical protein
MGEMNSWQYEKISKKSLATLDKKVNITKRFQDARAWSKGDAKNTIRIVP